MKNTDSALRLTGARVLRGEHFEQDDVTISAGRLCDSVPSGIAARGLDLSGYLLLPGIIDLHGDAFEHHLAPRPRAPFATAIALQSLDRDAAANGVTTAWLAQSWSWEGGSRGAAFAERFAAELAAFRPRMLGDLRLQLRCETHTVDSAAHLIDTVRRHGIGYVVFNDHIGEAIDMITSDPEGLAIWGRRAGRDLDAHVALIRATEARAPEVPAYLAQLSRAFAEMGVKTGSHDDADPATRARFAALGARICEFPITVAAARAARDAGDPVLMGAPNVVRGGSQSGNIAASDLIRAGLCDGLVSDYHYPALPAAAWTLVDTGLLALAQAWQMISTAPARIIGLADRGTIADGQRADLVICNAETRQIEGTVADGRWSHLCGTLAARLSGYP